MRKLLSLLLLGAAAWLAPTIGAWLVSHYALPDGVALAVSGARPVLPFGVRARELSVARGEDTIALAEPRLSWGPKQGVKLVAGLAGGQLRGGASTFGENAFLRFADVSLDALPQDGVTLAGSADAVVRFSDRVRAEIWVGPGTLKTEQPIAYTLPFRQVALASERAEGAWDIGALEVTGPPLTLSGTGQVGADGALDLKLRVHQLKEPLRTQLAFIAGGAKLDPPFDVSIGGTLEAPTLGEISPAE